MEYLITCNNKKKKKDGVDDGSDAAQIAEVFFVFTDPGHTHKKKAPRC